MGLTFHSVSGAFDVSLENSCKKTERLKRHSAIFLVGNFQAEIRISCLQNFFGILVSGFRSRFSLNKTDLGNPKRDYRTESALSANFYDTQPVEKESEVFSAARMASDPVTYDDIDF